MTGEVDNPITLSVVIPCYNAAATLKPLLDGLARQTLAREHYEIIVVDDGSSDQSPEIVAKFKDVRMLRQNRRGPGAARNLGTSSAQGDLVLYLDADLKVPADLLVRHVSFHEANPEVAATGGSVGPAVSLPVFSWRLVDHLSSWFNAHPQARQQGDPEYLPSLNFCVKKKWVCLDNGIKWADGLAHTGEDVLFCHELRQRGLRLAFLKKATVYHHDRATFRAYWRHMYNWGYHAPFVRGRFRNLQYSFLFPDSVSGFLLLSPLVILGYTYLIWRSWLWACPFKATLALPQLLLGRFAYVCGVFHGLRAKRGQQETGQSKEKSVGG